MQDVMSYLARAAAALTTSYVYTEKIDCSMRNQLCLYIDYTKGSSDSAEILVEFSEDGTNWYSETFQAVSTTTETDHIGVHTMTVAGSRRLMIPIMDRYVRFGCKATTSGTGTSMKLIARIGTV